MKIEDAQYVRGKIRDEGFHYCFKHYSRFREINDDEFHRLRENYLDYAKQLEDYINDQVLNGEDD